MVIIFKLSRSTHNLRAIILMILKLPRIKRCFCLKAYLLVRRTNQHVFLAKADWILNRIHQLTIPTRESFLQRKERDAFIQFIISITSFPKRTHHPFPFGNPEASRRQTQTHETRTHTIEIGFGKSQTVFAFWWKLPPSHSSRFPAKSWETKLWRYIKHKLKAITYSLPAHVTFPLPGSWCVTKIRFLLYSGRVL